jgi:hypothetical protein
VVEKPTKWDFRPKASKKQAGAEEATYAEWEREDATSADWEGYLEDRRKSGFN